MNSSEQYTIEDVEFKSFTSALAICIHILNEDMWIPRSQIIEFSVPNKTMTVTAWIAKQKGII